MSPRRRRLDEVLVREGQATDVADARRLIGEGRVLVAGAPAMSPARGVADGEPVVVVQPARFVGRGGEKLDGALAALDLEVGGSLALDVGSSTGGFTDCLLARGASRVLAVDVGRAQLHERLVADDRVVALERTNILDLTADDVEGALGGLAGIATVDLSFTSLEHVVGHVIGLLAPRGRLVALVKPQFEADYVEASRGRGVISDARVWRDAVTKCASAIERAGAGIIGVVASELKGAAGNVEFFVAAERGGPRADSLATWIDNAIEAAEGLG